jgi:uncharacterized membrane protein
MSELIVAGFKGTHRAAEVLDQIVERNAELAIHLKDAVAVYRTNGGKLRVDSSIQPTSKEGAVAGATIGMLIGSLLALPFTAGASAAGRRRSTRRRRVHVRRDRARSSLPMIRRRTRRSTGSPRIS